MYKFSIVSYFEKSVEEEIREVQKEISSLTGSSGSLVAWEPHITVGSGLEVKEEELDKFTQNVSEFCKTQNPAIIKTEGFSFMDNWSGAKLGLSPYVVYIKPVDYGSLVGIANYFEEQIKPNYQAWYDQPWPYNPHITVAYKDLSEEGFIKAKEALTETTFKREIKISSVSLCVEGQDGKWSPHKTFNLGQT